MGRLLSGFARGSGATGDQFPDIGKMVRNRGSRLQQADPKRNAPVYLAIPEHSLAWRLNAPLLIICKFTIPGSLAEAARHVLNIQTFMPSYFRTKILSSPSGRSGAGNHEGADRSASCPPLFGEQWLSGKHWPT